LIRFFLTQTQGNCQRGEWLAAARQGWRQIPAWSEALAHQRARAAQARMVGELDPVLPAISVPLSPRSSSATGSRPTRRTGATRASRNITAFIRCGSKNPESYYLDSFFFSIHLDDPAWIRYIYKRQP